MARQERLYATTLPDGRTFICCDVQLMKAGWKCPVTKKKVNPNSLEIEENK